MRRTESELPVLDERPITFDYDYRMHCGCGGISPLTALDFYTGYSRTAHMPCSHCNGFIHFGPAVAAIRNPNDPALDTSRLNMYAWYHTSTSSDWPSTAYAVTEAARLRTVQDRLSGLSFDDVLQHFVGQALHLGTYEAAIENMLRRMHDQDDGAADFYLHRVGLAVDPARVEDGYRDENHLPAAQLPAADLRAAGLDAVRYLNTHESVGSISLAVLPGTIATVQTIRLPLYELLPAHDEELLALLDEYQARLDHLDKTAPDTSHISPRRLRMMEFGVAARTGIGAARARHSEQVRDVWASVDAVLNGRYLTGVSPVIADDVHNAVSAWQSAAREPVTIRRHADFVAATLTSLSRPDAVTALLSTQPPRRSPQPTSTDEQAGTAGRDRDVLLR